MVGMVFKHAKYGLIPGLWNYTLYDWAWSRVHVVAHVEGSRMVPSGWKAGYSSWHERQILNSCYGGSVDINDFPEFNFPSLTILVYVHLGYGQARENK
eukprot:c23465_g1_i2 orf=767-1060(+)